jgi:hypothetical protein
MLHKMAGEGSLSTRWLLTDDYGRNAVPLHESCEWAAIWSYGTFEEGDFTPPSNLTE